MIYSCSVLSHLTEEAASLWLAEIARVLAPDGLALLSFNGLSNTVSYLSRRPDELRPVLAGELFDRDINSELKGFIPNDTYYRQVFGNDTWWDKMFAHHFRVEGYELSVVSGFQHLPYYEKPRSTSTPMRANAHWSLDFVHDQFACGRRFRVLNVVDDVTRESLAAIPDTSISGRRVARELTSSVTTGQD